MSSKTQSEVIAERYANQAVEIFIDGIIGRQQYNDYETEEKAIIEGIVKGADGEVLIIECVVTTAEDSRKCELLINGWAIKAVVKKSDGVPLLNIINLAQQFKRKR